MATRHRHRILVFALVAALAPYRTALAQVRFDQDATLRGIKSMVVLVTIEVQKNVAAIVDTQTARQSLKTAVELELRRSQITVPDTLYCSLTKCAAGFGVLWVNVLILEPDSDAVLASYEVNFKQEGVLQSGYSGFVSTWSTGGVLRVRPSVSSFQEGLLEGVNSSVRSFLNALLKVNSS